MSKAWSNPAGARLKGPFSIALAVGVQVTSYEPLRAYIYREGSLLTWLNNFAVLPLGLSKTSSVLEGLVRFASKPYSKDPKHLTA